MNKFLLSIIAILYGMMVSAQDLETLTLNNGKTLVGYTQKQDFTSRTISFVEVEGKTVVYMKDVKSQKLREDSPGSESYTIDIEFMDPDREPVRNAEWISDSPDSIVYRPRSSGNDKIHTISFSDRISVVKDYMSISKEILDEFELQDGSIIKGIVTKTLFGSTITITNDKGSKTIPISDIIVQRKFSTSKKDVVDVVDMFDSVEFSDGSTIVGAIVELNHRYHTITIQKMDKDIEERELNEIDLILKIKK